MKKTLEYVMKALGLVLKGYGGWIVYRAARYVRSYFSPTSRAHHSTSEEWLRPAEAQAMIQEFNQAFKKTHTTALCLHLYYGDVLKEVLDQPLVKTQAMDFYISLGPNVDRKIFGNLAPYKGRVKLYQFSNRGRDVYPFLKIYPELMDYQWVCKIHSKRSPQIRDGELWRQDLIGDLLGEDSLARLQNCDSSQPLIAPQNSLLPGSLFMGANRPRIQELLQKMGLAFPQKDFVFVAGTMFWFRPRAFKRLLQLGDVDLLFEEESPTIDGLTAHAFERFFYLIAHS